MILRLYIESVRWNFILNHYKHANRYLYRDSKHVIFFNVLNNEYFLLKTWDEYMGITNRFETSITLPSGFSREEVPALVVGQVLYVVVSVSK